MLKTAKTTEAKLKRLYDRNIMNRYFAWKMEIFLQKYVLINNGPKTFIKLFSGSNSLCKVANTENRKKIINMDERFPKR